MYRYEVLILTIPTITQDELAGLETQVQEVVRKNEATVLSFERWGKFRLAYPVSRNDYGVYFLLRFEAEKMPTVALEAIRLLLSVDQRNLVMRFVVDMLNPRDSLEYQRPPSLEETPAKELGSFGRGEGRGRHEGRGNRPGFHRSRGARSEGEYGRGRQEYDAPTHGREEAAVEHDMTSGEIEQ